MQQLEQKTWGPEFAQALCAIQAEKPVVPMDKKNPRFGSKYASLDSLIKVAHDLLSRHGMCFSQHVSDGVCVTYIVHAETGQYMASSTPIMTDRADAQSYGSGCTYSRRYGLSSILGLVGDEDDDGNAVSPTPQNRRRKPPEKDKRPMTDKQMAHIRKLLRDAVGDDAKSVSDWLEHMGRPRVSAMSHAQGMWLVKALDGGGNPTISRESLGAFAAERAAKEVGDA